MVVGCGGIGGGYPDRDGLVLTHASAFQASKAYQLIACVEPDESRRIEFMQRWRIDAGYRDLAEWRRDANSIDVVSVCVPTERHADVLGQLLEQPPRAVLCEKPLTGDPARSGALVAAYRRAGCLLAVCYQRRHDPTMRMLRDELRAGRWGAVQSATAFYDKGICNNGSHALDLLRFLLGEITPLAAWKVTNGAARSDPTVDAVLVAQGGVRVHLVGGDFRHFELFEVVLITAGGVLSVEQGGFRFRVRATTDDPVYFGYRVPGLAEERDTGLGRALLAVMEGISAAMVNGSPLVGDAEDAVVTEKLCRALADMASSSSEN